MLSENKNYHNTSQKRSSSRVLRDSKPTAKSHQSSKVKKPEYSRNGANKENSDKNSRYPGLKLPPGSWI